MDRGPDRPIRIGPASTHSTAANTAPAPSDAIADGIEAGLKAEGMRPISTEGARTGQWALLDYGDFVVHVFCLAIVYSLGLNQHLIV